MGVDGFSWFFPGLDGENSSKGHLVMPRLLPGLDLYTLYLPFVGFKRIP